MVAAVEDAVGLGENKKRRMGYGFRGTPLGKVSRKGMPRDANAHGQEERWH